MKSHFTKRTEPVMMSRHGNETSATRTSNEMPYLKFRHPPDDANVKLRN